MDRTLILKALVVRTVWAFRRTNLLAREVLGFFKRNAFELFVTYCFSSAFSLVGVLIRPLADILWERPLLFIMSQFGVSQLFVIFWWFFLSFVFSLVGLVGIWLGKFLWKYRFTFGEMFLEWEEQVRAAQARKKKEKAQPPNAYEPGELGLIAEDEEERQMHKMN